MKLLVFLSFFLFTTFSVRKKHNTNMVSKTGSRRKIKKAEIIESTVTKVNPKNGQGNDNDESKSIIQNTIGISKKIAYTLSKASRSALKSTIDLCVVKHITEDQLHGKWLFRQDVEVHPGIFVSCPATIQFLEDGNVVTVFEGTELKSKFTFKERSWPLKCTIKFEAQAFQEFEGAQPIKLIYKGYFKGSLTNPRVLLMRGKMYRQSGSIWKKQKRCGTFKAMKRRYH